ncbi:MAG: hypothetical protein WD097_10250 [Balneolales bacterium]
MDWSKRWSEEDDQSEFKEERTVFQEGRKWNYVFLQSLKMALFLPLVVLMIEIFILRTWPDIRERTLDLLYDYFFMFSLIFLVFVIFHLLQWRRRSNLH